jgi:hypothetical protein
MDKQEECNCGVGDAGSDIGHFEDCPALKDKQEERKFDESRLIYLWEKDSYKELREYFIDCFERLLTTPNPSYSQDEVDRLRSKDRDTLIEMIKENTLKNRYRDGETAYDIVKDIKYLSNK